MVEAEAVVVLVATVAAAVDLEEVEEVLEVETVREETAKEEAAALVVAVEVVAVLEEAEAAVVTLEEEAWEEVEDMEAAITTVLEGMTAMMIVMITLEEWDRISLKTTQTIVVVEEGAATIGVAVDTITRCVLKDTLGNTEICCEEIVRTSRNCGKGIYSIKQIAMVSSHGQPSPETFCRNI